MRLLLFILLFAGAAAQQQAAAQAKTEKELVQNIISQLQAGDDSSYVAQFPTMALFSEQINTFGAKDSFQLARIERLRSNMKHLQQFDPELNTKILDMLHFVRKKGADSGVHWGDILIAKYELDKQRLPPELIGLELISPLRMQGYIFIRDMLTRRRYGIAVRDVLFINNQWYGGVVLNILEATSAAEYEEELAIEEAELRKLMVAKRQGKLDSIMAARDSIKQSRTLAVSDEDDEEQAEAPMYKEVADRKIYTGYFDKNIEVELYIRSIKGTCPEAVCAWEAMYKFGNLDNYIILHVERKPDGTFVLAEEELGIMELKLTGDTFTGTWTSVKDKTEYEAHLKEKVEVKDRKLFKLDKTYEETKWK